MNKETSLKIVLSAGITLTLSGCFSNTSMIMDATGAKKGELPVFQQAAFTSAQADFRSKLEQYHNTNQMPVDTSSYSSCDLNQNILQDISGFTAIADLLDTTRKNKDKDSEKSLSARIGQDASSAVGQDIQQTYNWQGGALYASTIDCQKLINNADASKVSFLIDSQYLIKTTGANFKGTHSITEKKHIQRIAPDHTVSISLHSTIIGDDFTKDFGTKLALSLSNLKDPSFIYTYKNGNDLLIMSEAPSSPGIYFTQHFITLNKAEKRTRSYRYTGAAQSGIGRSLNDKAHGLQETFGKYGSKLCFDQGELVEKSDCEAF
ncbi:hypothetical protein [Marinomonas algarum]|uniref:Lipoprotein n=1 Tax=Marinomonas algarum TaxID=2883105 RepID=A0A9X1LFK8_9GAMM|nr:hypothetical protein [Marinomonas algarum]MCB5163017.1 hypothetical protein [Marinomonas algarum]